MPENLDPNQGNEGSVGNSTVQAMRKQIKDLEDAAAAAQAEAEAGKSAVTEAAALKEQLATFQKAAVFDQLNIPSTGPGKLLRDTYTGDITAEAITAKATEYGLIPTAPTTAQPTIPGINQDAMARQQQALAGTAPSTAPNPLQQLAELRNTPNAWTGQQAAIEILRSQGVLAE